MTLVVRLLRAGLAAGMLFHAFAARAQEQVQVDGGEGQHPITIEADSLSAGENGERVEATGHVVVGWEGYKLRADRVWYQRARETADAEGDVVLEDESGNLLRARRISIHTGTQEAEVFEGEITMVREGYRVWGKRMRKTGPNRYLVEEGGFTPCDGSWPSWRVEASRVRVELEGYLVARGASFWVERAPVLYLPYFVFPVKRERQSGFLIPKVGYSDRAGFLFVLPYYWAFSESADAVLRLEYRSARGLTEALQLRYALAEGHQGSAEVSHLYDRSDESNRYTIRADHASRFSEASKLRLHIDYLGDTGYLQDFGDTIHDRGVERLENYVLATRVYDPGTLFGFAEYIQALAQPQATVLQTLPRIGFLGRETPLIGGLHLEPTARFTRFQREVGEAGERLEIDPGISWGGGFRGVGFSARARYREHLYRLDDERISRGALQGSVGASAMLARTFGSIVHTIEPKVVYLWQEKGRGGEVPQFDTADFFAERSEIGLLVESRWLRSEDLSPIAGLELERRIDLAASTHDWRGEANLTPSPRAQFRAEAEFDPTERSPWQRWSAGGVVSDHRGDSLSGSFHYVKGRASYAEGTLSVAATRELSFLYRRAHSSRDERTLEESYGIQLAHSCWSVLTTYSRNYRLDLDGYERRYLVFLQLKGLGTIGTLRGVLP
jgi:LPS-assembly protein